MMVEAPLVYLQNLLSLVIAYWLMELRGEFFFISFTMWLLGVASNSTAMLVGSLVEDPKTAAEAAPLLFVPQILFSGFFIRVDQIPVYLRWAQYACSLKYAMNLVLLIEFTDCGDAEMQCDNLLALNDIEDHLWWLYVVILLGIFLGLRLISLFVLKKKAKVVLKSF